MVGIALPRHFMTTAVMTADTIADSVHALVLME